MNSRFIGYPTGWILAVFDESGAAERAAAGLRAAGVSDDDLMLLVGADAARRLDGLGTSSGLVARLRRLTQFLAMDQMPDFLMYEVALREGRAVLGVRPADKGRSRVIEILRGDGAHFINRFGNWATEEISAWRGPMPDIPPLMRR
jgi:hypothetical protein